MTNHEFRIRSNLKTHGFDFAVKAELKRLARVGVPVSARGLLARQNVLRVAQ